MDSRSCDPIPSCEETVASTEEVSKTEDQESKSPPPGQVQEAKTTKLDDKSAEQHKAESGKQMEKKMLSRSFTQPKGTEEYQVKASDTLSSIAAKFHTTPSELAKLNRLTTRMIFPGQLLFVPERKGPSDTPGDAAAESFTEGPGKQESAGLPEGSESKTGSCYNGIGGKAEKMDSEDGDSSLPKRKVSVTDALRIPYRRHSDRMQRFLKVKARHFTDGQGVVAGVLIITPNAVMFDPNVSDPLVIEHGIESYGVIAPLNMVMRAAIYFDIAHMKVKNAPETTINIPKPDIYYGKMSDDNVAPDSSAEKSSEEAAVGRVPAEKSHEQDGDRIPEAAKDDDGGGGGGAKLGGPVVKEEENKATDSNLLTIQESPSEKQAAEKRRDSCTRDGSLDKEVSEAFADGKKQPVSQGSSESPTPPRPPSEGSGQLKAENQADKQAPESRKEKMLKRLSYPMESITSYTQSSLSRILSSSPKSLVDFSGGLFVKTVDEDMRKEEVGPTSATTQEVKPVKGPSASSEGSVDEVEETEVAKPKESPAGSKQSSIEKTGEEKTVPSTAKVGYKNLVEEEKPEVFAVLDRLLSQHSGREQEGPPLYLCLRMGHPKGKKTPTSTPILSYGKKKAKSEYWFGIPHNRVEDTYNFLQQWFPHLYGDVDDVDPDAVGFVPVDEDAEEEEEEEKEEQKAEDQEQTEGENQKGSSHISFLKLVEDHFGIRSISPTDWEVLSMNDSEKLSFVDFELPLPELLTTSEIFQEEHVKELYTLLPARAVGYPWTLIFSTSLHGFNLKTLYRKMSTYDTPVLLAIVDIQGCVFGSLVSSPLRQSDHFYGNGETFLYTFHPEFKVFKWTGENMYFVKGDPDSIAIGAGDGRFGIWIDGDLNHGRTQKCLTFDNDVLSKTEDFVIKTLEVWGFV